MAGLALAATGAAEEVTSFQQNPAHDGHAAGERIEPPLERAWTKELGDHASHPLIADGRVFVAVEDSETDGVVLHALDRGTGASLWSRALAASGGRAGLAYENGKVFVIAPHGVGLALDATSGRTLWAAPMYGDKVVASGGVLYTSAFRGYGTAHAYSQTDGRETWRSEAFDPGFPYEAPAPAVEGTRLFFSTRCGQDHALAQEDGRRLWGRDSSCQVKGYGASVASGGKVWASAGAAKGEGRVLLASDGTVLRSFRSTRLPVVTGSLAVYTDGDELRAEDAVSGVSRWRFTASDRLATAPVVAGGHLFAATADGTLHVLDVATGRELDRGGVGSSLPAQEQESAGPLTGLAAGEGTLVVPARNRLTAFTAASGAPPGQNHSAPPPATDGGRPPADDGSARAFQINPRHDGHLTAATPRAPLRRRWDHPLRDSSYPVVADGKVFVTEPESGDAFKFGENAWLRAFDARTGRLLWTRILHGGQTDLASVAYDSGRVFATDGGRVHALAADSGATLWEKGSGFEAPPVAVDGLVYAVDGDVYAFDQATGALRWKKSIIRQGGSAVAVDDETVWAGFNCGGGFGFERETLATINDDLGCDLTHLHETPVISGGRAYVRDGEHGINVYDSRRGGLRDSLSASTPPAFAGGLAVSLNHRTLQGASAADGRIRWEFRGDGGLTTAPIIVGSQVFVASSSGRVFVLDLATGRRLGTTALGDEIRRNESGFKTWSGLGAGDGILAVPTKNRLVALESDAGSEGEDSDAPDTRLEPMPRELLRTRDVPATFSSSEAGSSFQCRADLGDWKPCASPHTFLGLTDGEHVLRFRAIDSARNVDPTPAVATVRIDAPPVVAFRSSPPSPRSSDNDPAFQLRTSDAGSTFECRLDAGNWAACKPDEYGAYIRYTDVPDGEHVFGARAIDPSGQTGPVLEHRWIVDAVGPQPTIDSPADRAVAARDDPQLSGVAATGVGDGDHVRVGVFRPGSTTPVREPRATAVDGRWSASISRGLPDGEYRIRAKQIDVAGNWGYGPFQTMTVETSPPQTRIASGPSGTQGRDGAFSFTSSEAGSSFECRLDGVVWSPCSSPYAVSGLADGDHTFAVRATDSAGRVDPSPAERTWRVDPEAPAVTLTSPTDGDVLSPYVHFEGTAAPPGPGRGRAEIKIWRGESTAGDPSCQRQSYVRDDGTWTHHFADCGLTNGVYTARVDQSDSSSGRTGRSGTVRFEVDHRRPQTWITAVPVGPARVPVFRFESDDPNAVFRCQSERSGDSQPCESPYEVHESRIGDHEFVVSAVNPRTGQGDETPARHEFTVAPGPASAGPSDTEPQTTILSAPNDPEGVDEKDEEPFVFVSGKGATFECRLDEGEWSPCSSGKVYSNLPGGDWRFSVRAIDASGEVDPSPATRVWNVDRTPPSSNITDGPSGVSASTTARFYFVSDGSARHIDCKLDDGPWQECRSPKDLSDLSDGEHTFSTRAVDWVGNVERDPPSRTWTVDARPPDTTLVGGPSGLTRARDAAFSFSSEAGATFECRLDAGEWSACDSPKALSDLSEGEHVFGVRAKDALGKLDPSPAERRWTVDSREPDTTIGEGPSGGTTATEASFSFSSEPGVTFECRLDGGDWSTCTSPKRYAGLEDGNHLFEARAREAAGNIESTPAERRWTVDAGQPETELSGGPEGSTRAREANFTFDSDEAGAVFECRLDGGAWSLCVSPKRLEGLADGERVFEVRAKDLVGHVDPSPARRTWTIDNLPPETAMAGGPPARTRATDASFTLSSESGATLECRLDEGDWESCSSPRELRGLTDGEHAFEARSVDPAGNVDATPSSHRWTVDTAGPDTQVTGGPPLATADVDASLTFEASEPGAAFRCSLDGAAAEDCTSPKTYRDLAEGQHTFTVAASDSLGNADATPATHSWTISRPTDCDRARRSSLDVTTTTGTVTGTAGDDTIVGTSAGEKIDGRGGDDLICGRGGSDELEGGTGVDLLDGESGDDRLNGGDGNDRALDGGEGNDVLDGGQGGELLLGGPGLDTVTYAARRRSVSVRLDARANDGDGDLDDRNRSDGTARAGDDVRTERILAGSGADRLAGSAGGDGLFGGAGADVLTGYGGADTLDGGAGDDTLAARSSARDRDARLACGENRGDRDRASIDAEDPRPSGCEVSSRD